MSLQQFTSVSDFSAALRLTEKLGLGNTLFFEAQPGHANVFRGPAMRQSYSVKPQGMQSTVKPGDKFEINLQVDDGSPFVEACNNLDAFVKGAVFARKAELLPAKASLIKSPDSLDVLFASGHLIKAGAKDKNGGKYPDTLRLRIAGEWADSVTGVNTRVVNMKGTEKTVVDTCEWKGRDKPLKPEETKFYLFVRTNEEGKDVYADRIVEAGTGISRLVGPQDCAIGATITPVFTVSHMYFNEGMGIVATARALYIKPAVREEGEAGASGSDSAAFTSRTTEAPLLDDVVVEKHETTTTFGAGTKRERSDSQASGAQTKRR